MEQIVLTEAVFYILLSLDEPRHGYGIMQLTEQLSGGRIRLAAGTLYGALNTLMNKGWITPIDDSGVSRKKEYIITSIGRQIVLQELKRLQELVRNGEALTGGWKHE